MDLDPVSYVPGGGASTSGMFNPNLAEGLCLPTYSSPLTVHLGAVGPISWPDPEGTPPSAPPSIERVNLPEPISMGLAISGIAAFVVWGVRRNRFALESNRAKRAQRHLF
jgi:hypothetical protein